MKNGRLEGWKIEEAMEGWKMKRILLPNQLKRVTFTQKGKHVHKSSYPRNKGIKK